MAGENRAPEDQPNLFGEVWLRTSGARGRPPFQWTLENSNKVNMLLAAGWSNDRIASVIFDPRTGKPISVPTLKRHFRSELRVRDSARDRMEAERMMRVWTQAQGGNVGAERFFAQLLERNDRMEVERSFAAKPKEQPEKVGKKVMDEQKALDADAALSAELEREAEQGVRH